MTSEYVQLAKELIDEKLLDAQKFGKSIKKALKAQPQITKEVHIKTYLRHAALRNFGIFAYFYGFNVNDSPYYRQYYEPIDAVELPMLEAYAAGDKEEFERLQMKRIQFAWLFIPRGARKSTLINIRAAWKYIRNILLIRQAPVSLLLHADKDRVADNMYGVQNVFKSHFISELYYDVLETVNSNKKAIKFMDNESKIKHKEGHFISGSVNGGIEGKHATYFYPDDWVTQGSCDTAEKNQKNKEAFDRIYSLDDHQGFFCSEGAGTMYPDNSLYHDFIEDAKNGENKHIYHIVLVPLDNDPYRELDPSERVEYFPNIINKEEEARLNRLRKRNPKLYYSQYYMISYPLEDDLSLVSSKDYIFAFKDEPVNTMDRTVLSVTREEMLKNSGVIVSKDPSFSVMNKKWNDAGSKDTTITCCVKDRMIFVVDSTQLLGGEPTTLYDVAKDQVQKNGASMFVMDAQGTQIGYFQMFVDWFSRDGVNVLSLPHRKGSAVTGKGKAQRAALILGEMFASGRIFIHQSLTSLINQIERINKGYDFLDVLIQVAILDLDAVEFKGSNYGTKSIDYFGQDFGEIEYVDSITGD